MRDGGKERVEERSDGQSCGRICDCLLLLVHPLVRSAELVTTATNVLSPACTGCSSRRPSADAGPCRTWHSPARPFFDSTLHVERSQRGALLLTACPLRGQAPRGKAKSQSPTPIIRSPAIPASQHSHILIISIILHHPPAAHPTHLPSCTSSSLSLPTFAVHTDPHPALSQPITKHDRRLASRCAHSGPTVLHGAWS